MTQDLMNYEQMTQLALRGVVRDAIRRVIREDGLPGAHHFYIPIPPCRGSMTLVLALPCNLMPRPKWKLRRQHSHA